MNESRPKIRKRGEGGVVIRRGAAARRKRADSEPLRWSPEVHEMLGRGESGTEAEVRTFGKPQENDSFGPLFEKAIRPSTNPRLEYFVSFRDGLNIVFEGTEQDPENPSAEFANDLRLELQDLISEAGLEDSDGMPEIRIWNSVDTPIDKVHGVDAIVEYVHPDFKKPIQVTLDVTLRPDKVDDQHKADLAFYAPPDANLPEEEKYYLPYVKNTARDVLRLIRNKVEEQQAGVARAGAVTSATRRRSA